MTRHNPTMKQFHSSMIFVPILVMAVAGSLLGAASGDFRASCVKVDITPDESLWLLGYGPRKSEGVHDRLYHRIAAMDDGKMQFLSRLLGSGRHFSCLLRTVFQRIGDGDGDQVRAGVVDPDPHPLGSRGGLAGNHQDHAGQQILARAQP